MQYANKSVPAESTIENIQIYVYRPHRDCTALSAQIVLNVENYANESYNISVYDHNKQLITAVNMGFSSVSIKCFNLLHLPVKGIHAFIHFSLFYTKHCVSLP